MLAGENEISLVVENHILQERILSKSIDFYYPKKGYFVNPGPILQLLLWGVSPKFKANYCLIRIIHSTEQKIKTLSYPRCPRWTIP